MPSFSRQSERRLVTCHPVLQQVFREVVRYFDCTILTGHREEDEQDEAFRSGHSKLVWPKSSHNKHPSHAVDAAPYPIDWNDRERFHLFAGHVLAIARARGHYLRWGGDWDRDTQVKDNTFDDLVHYEIMKELPK